jgi:hypothetical protein
LVEQYQIVGVADRALDEADIHACGIFLHVGDGAVDEFDFSGELDEKLIEVEERHVAAGATAEPNRGNF